MEFLFNFSLKTNMAVEITLKLEAQFHVEENQ